MRCFGALGLSWSFRDLSRKGARWEKVSWISPHAIASQPFISESPSIQGSAQQQCRLEEHRTIALQVDLNLLQTVCGRCRADWINGQIENLQAKITLVVRLHGALQNWQQGFSEKLCKLMVAGMCLMQVSTQKARAVSLSTHDACRAQRLQDLWIRPQRVKCTVCKKLVKPKLQLSWN